MKVHIFIALKSFNFRVSVTILKACNLQVSVFMTSISHVEDRGGEYRHVYRTLG